MFHGLRASKWLYIAAICTLLLWFAPRIYARTLANYAQVSSLRGTVRRDVYQQALHIAQNDAHIRWQTGAAQVAVEDWRAAVKTLLPLAQQQPVNPQVADLLIEALYRSDQARTALHLYESLSDKPALSQQAAATIALLYIEQRGSIPPDRAASLFAQAFAWAEASPFLVLLQQSVRDPLFWSTPEGQRTTQALRWRSQYRPAPEPTADTTAASMRSAHLLHLPPATVRLGPNLALNGSFEQLNTPSSNPSGWDVSFMSTGNPWNRASFVLGTDPQERFAGDRALRIDGLMIERLPQLEGARAGFWHGSIMLATQTPYVISFVYRTEAAGNGSAALWIAHEDRVFDGYGQEQWFPATNGQWKRVTLIGRNRSLAVAPIAPLLRSWGEGSVWFDDFSVQAITGPTLAADLPQMTIIDIADAE